MNAHDERISSFLDDAMPAGERSAFESELLDNAELRQQVIELRQLRQDVALLPRYSVTEGFAQRVVAAAISAKANENANITLASTPSSKTVRRATIGVLAIAASLLIMVGTMVWNNGRKPIDVAVKPTTNSAVAPVLAALPGEDQVLVVRITSPKDLATGSLLREALAEQGIEKKRPSDQTTGSGLVRKAYKEKLGTSDATTAADALFLQISPEELELALNRVAKSGPAVTLTPEQHLAVASLPVKPAVAPNTPAAEDVPGNQAIAAETSKKPEFVQELTPSLFQLPKATGNATPSVSSSAAPKGKVRVLILIEQAK
ncbi:anti-sigma factor family protein [Anatilimnocola floriformis]|uniref:anti-sigma factor family protein n=1 Tax=Anatilimnocola floriformis TaxID=2948575 RepID=UPI0020C40B15|nr:hypothetical protein [Anatilimnocola floriformis]